MTRTETIQLVTENQPNITRMVLRPETLDIRESFRDILVRRYQNNIGELPYINNLNTTENIDSNTIIELNNSTTSERRLELVNNILNYQNNRENSSLLIENSSPQVRTYLHDLLIRSSNNNNISEDDLYRVGNIFLYTVSNLDIDETVLRDVIQNMRESMVVFNNNRIFSILDTQVTNYNSYLDDVGLASDEQLNDRVEEFNREIDQRIESTNRKRLLLTTAGVLGTLALTSMGAPSLVSGILVRSITATSNIISDTNSGSEIIRVRDVFDEGVKWFYKTIKHFNI